MIEIEIASRGGAPALGSLRVRDQNLIEICRPLGVIREYARGPGPVVGSQNRLWYQS